MYKQDFLLIQSVTGLRVDFCRLTGAFLGLVPVYLGKMNGSDYCDPRFHHVCGGDKYRLKSQDEAEKSENTTVAFRFHRTHKPKRFACQNVRPRATENSEECNALAVGTVSSDAG